MDVQHEIIAALRDIRGELSGIRQALVGATPAPVEDDQPPACTHPADQLIDFGITGGQHDFECRVCGFRSVTSEAVPV